MHQAGKERGMQASLNLRTKRRKTGSWLRTLRDASMDAAPLPGNGRASRLNNPEDGARARAPRTGRVADVATLRKKGGWEGFLPV
jgi:hypothetical protein